MEKLDWNRDNANLFKLVVTGKGGSPFYMNQVDIVIGFSMQPKTYFDPVHTN